MNFLSENFPFLVVRFSIYLNRRVFIMKCWYQLCRYCFISQQKHILWYSLEAPPSGTSNEYTYKIFFCGEIR